MRVALDCRCCGVCESRYALKQNGSVPIVCDDPAIQAVLPQIIIGNEHTIPAALLAELRAACPAPVKLLRRRSAWVNKELFVEVVNLIAAALAPFVHGVQPFLLFDTCTSHLHLIAFNACIRANIWPHLVPPRMTWFLQPLDAKGFAGYKLIEASHDIHQLTIQCC